MGGMRKINIHFENPEIAIPLIFEQLVGINQNNQKNIKTKIDYNHVFIAEDTFVEWMMNYIRIHINCQHINEQYDERIDQLFDILEAIYDQSKYNKYIIQKTTKKNKKRKSKININPFEAAPSSPNKVKRQIMFKNLGIPPRQHLNEYHQYNKYQKPLNMNNIKNNQQHNNNNNNQIL